VLGFRVTVLLWLLYFLLPSERGVIDGVPLGRVETIGVLLVLWIAAHRGRIPGARTAATLAVLASVAAAAVPGERGLTARYFATESPSGPFERSTEYRGAGFTRIDARLDFARGTHDLPLAFFNDHTRFNFMQMGQPDRRGLAFAVTWTAWLHVADHRARRYYLHAPGSSAQLSIDATPILTATSASPAPTLDLALAEGWHRVHITFSSPYQAPREFSAGEIENGVRMPFDAARTRTERIDERSMALASVVGAVKHTADWAALAWLSALSALILLRRAGEVWSAVAFGAATDTQRAGAYTAAVALFMAAAATEAIRFAWPWAERLRIMVAGDDTMVYEGYARDILFNGILMNGGLPPGAAEPFYFQAFYPYFLAATHALFGDSFFGALFLQRLFVAVTAVALTRIAIRLRGVDGWPVALAVSTLFGYWKLAPISADLLSESLYVPLLAVWAWLSVELATRPSIGLAAWTGLAGGLTAMTRTTILLAWPMVWSLLFAKLRTSPFRTSAIAILAAVSLALFSLIGIRNAVASHQFALTPTGLGVTLRGGNEPPPGLTLSRSRVALYERLGVGGHTADVIEYAIAAPRAFAANTVRKALFVLGFYEAWMPGWGYSPVYVATWISALGGAWLLWFRLRGDTLTAWLPAVMALTQFVAIVIVYPRGERLIVPIHTLLIPYSAIMADWLWRWRR